MTQIILLTLQIAVLLLSSANTPEKIDYALKYATDAGQKAMVYLADAKNAPVVSTSTPVIQTVDQTPVSAIVEQTIVNPLPEKVFGVSAPVVQVLKDIHIEPDSCLQNINGTYCSGYVEYREDGHAKSGVLIALTSDDNGEFIPASGFTRTRDNRLYFQYLPKSAGVRTISATTNGVSTSLVVQGQIAKCVGFVSDGTKFCNQ